MAIYDDVKQQLKKKEKKSTENKRKEKQKSACKEREIKGELYKHLLLFQVRKILKNTNIAKD